MAFPSAHLLAQHPGGTHLAPHVAHLGVGFGLIAASNPGLPKPPAPRPRPTGAAIRQGLREPTQWGGPKA